MKTKISSIFILFALLVISGCSDKTPVTVTSPPTVQPPFQKTYGGSVDDIAFSMRSVSNGYIVAGYTGSFGAGSNDMYILRLSSDGSVTWSKTFGGANSDIAYSVSQTSDGGYIVAGYTLSFGAGGLDMYVVRLASDGSPTWSKTFGGANSDIAYSVPQTSDGGYIVAGHTNSFGAGSYDMYILCLSSDGSVTWSKTFGGAGNDYAYSVSQTSDGGYIVAGYTGSFGAGSADIYILRLTSEGNIAWSKTFGGANSDIAYSVSQTSDGGYIVAGHTLSFGAGGLDMYVVRLSSDGSIVWSKTFGGANGDAGQSISQTSDGGYIVAGYTAFSGAGYDVYVVKLSSDGSVMWSKTIGGANYDDVAYSISQTPDGGYIIAGSTGSSGGYDVYVVKLSSDGTVCGSSTTPSTLVSPPSTVVSTAVTIINTPASVVNSPGSVTGSAATQTTVICADSD